MVVYIGRKAATNPSLVGTRIADWPPEWISGAGTGTGQNVDLADVNGSANSDLALAVIMQQTVNTWTAPAGWTVRPESTNSFRFETRTINNDISSLHRWSLVPQGITRGGIIATFRNASIDSTVGWTNSNIIPTMTSPGEGSILVVAVRRLAPTDRVATSGDLVLQQSRLYRGSAAYQTTTELSLFVETGLPAGQISGRSFAGTFNTSTNGRAYIIGAA